MISTSIISNSPLVFKHVLSTAISEVESQKGVDEAIRLVNSKVSIDKKFKLLVNVANYSFETLEARRIWSIQFKMNSSIQRRVSHAAIVGSPSEVFNTEKIWMETTNLKFFEQEDEALKWLMETG